MIIGIDGNEANVQRRVGSGQFAYELLRQFSQNKKHQFLVYLKEKPLADLPKDSKNFKYLVFGPKKFWTQLVLPLKLFIGPQIDVFFSPSHYAPRFCPFPTVITIFDLSYLYFPPLFRKKDLYQLKNWTAYSVKKSKAIITISQFSKKDIVKNYQVGAKNVTVAYPGYDRLLFKPQTKSKIDAVKKKYGISGDYIFYLGTIQPRKNLIRLLEAFDQVIRQSGILKNPTTRKPGNLQLVMAGKKGWLYDEFFEKAGQMKGKVILTDFGDEADLPALFSGAKAYVLPSLYEGFGIPVIEAQACGTPVVVSNTSSLPEIVGESGILVDPESTESIADGIKKVLVDQKTGSLLVKKGFENIKRFSWEKCAKEVLTLLEKVASKSIP